MKLKLLAKKVLSHFPTQIPTGMTQFNTWLDSIVELAGPIADPDSLKWVVSNEVMRLSSTRNKVPKSFFIKSLRKYAANQLAAATVMELKQKQEVAQKALQAEATANTKADSSGQTSQ